MTVEQEFKLAVLIEWMTLAGSSIVVYILGGCDWLCYHLNSDFISVGLRGRQPDSAEAFQRRRLQRR